MSEEKCVQMIYSGAWSRPHQCKSKAKKDGYCMRHHPESVAKRAEKSNREYQEKREKHPIVIASKRIKELEQQRDELLAALKDARSIFALAYDCAENGRNDECLLHTGMGGAISVAAIEKAEKQLEHNADLEE